MIFKRNAIISLWKRVFLYLFLLKIKMAFLCGFEAGRSLHPSCAHLLADRSLWTVNKCRFWDVIFFRYFQVTQVFLSVIIFLPQMFNNVVKFLFRSSFCSTFCHFSYVKFWYLKFSNVFLF